MKRALLGALLVIASGAASAAELSVMPWLGKNEATLGKNGWWRQAPLPYELDDASTAFGIELGWRVASWARLSVGYFDRGEHGGSGVFVADDLFAAGKHAGSKDTYTVTWMGRGRGLTFSFDPIWQVTPNFAVFGQIGRSLTRGEFRILERCGYGLTPCHKTETGQSHSTNEIYIEDSNSRYYAIGIEYRSVVLSAYYAPDERAAESAFKGNTGVQIGYRFSFHATR